MNPSDYSKPQTLLSFPTRQDSASGISWRGYLTRAVLLAIGLGGYVLLSRRIDFGGNGKRCFYALRKYFPRGKEKTHRAKNRRSFSSSYDDEPCPVCLGNPKTGTTANLFVVAAADLPKLSILDECRGQTEHKAILRDQDQNPKDESDRFPKTFWRNLQRHYLRRNLIAWILLLVALITTKLEVLNRREFIQRDTIFDFLMPLAVMPMIYIWCMYRIDSPTSRR